MKRGGVTYITTNSNNSTLYCGVTSDLRNRIVEHMTKIYPRSFSARYNLNKLVYYESFSTIEAAIAHEKYIKGKKRSWKNELIYKTNPNWLNLWEEIKDW